MAGMTQAERLLIDGVRDGDEDAWRQLVDRFQGRLLAVARPRVRSLDIDPEDLVQDTFIAFLKAVHAFEDRSSLETFLFAILRRRIIDKYRGGKLPTCSLSETGSEDLSRSDSLADRLAGDAPAPSMHARVAERDAAWREALLHALRTIIERYIDRREFEPLKIAEMLFYCRLRNKRVAEVAGVPEPRVALLKHRWLAKLRETASGYLAEQGLSDAASDTSPLDGAAADQLLSELWEQQRISCLKRSTIGALVLGTLDEAWADYTRFHLDVLGCRFCQANLEDVQAQSEPAERETLRTRVLNSTVGFLPRRA